MQRFGTGSSRSWCGRAGTATIAAVLLASGALTGLPPAYAISPPTIDPGALPPDGPPGPLAPMKQNAYCTEVGVLPGTDFQLQPKYMEMLNLNEAWQHGRADDHVRGFPPACGTHELSCLSGPILPNRPGDAATVPARLGCPRTHWTCPLSHAL